MRVAVTGAGGQLGRDLALALSAHEMVPFDRSALDVTDAAACMGAIGAAGPDAVIHAAAWTDVDGCELDPARAEAVNTQGAANVLSAASEAGAFTVIVSTDYVFDGRADRPYVEGEEVSPIQVYGASKLGGEATEGAATVRSAWLYGPARADGRAPRNFIRWVLSTTGPIDVVTDQVGSPTPTSALAASLAGLCEARTPGLFHVACAGAASRYDLAVAAIEMTGGDPGRVRACRTADLPARPAARPAFAPLDGPAWRAAGFASPPDWREALERSLSEEAWT